MASSQRSTPPRPCLSFIIGVFITLLLILLSSVFRPQQQEDRHTRDVLDATEFPAEHIDPAAIDLTPLVNTLINSSQSGSRQLFSLLSVTSYSSLALHKLTLLLYNISSVRRVESDMFRRRFCYCVTNDTNDLTDFTAVLLDVIGNSTSFHELFKSASILSVSQRNCSDCTYICVMAGHTREVLPQLWGVDSMSPLFNQTIVEGPHGDWNHPPHNLSHMTASGVSALSISRVHDATDHVSSTSKDDSAKMAATRLQTTIRPQSQTTAGDAETTQTLQTHRATLHSVTAAMSMTTTSTEVVMTTGRLTTTSKTVESPGCPWRKPQLTGERTSSRAATMTTAAMMGTVGVHKLQPCVLELCSFFSQCLCRQAQHGTNTRRFCDESHVWYEKHTSEVCRRVRRISFSRNLKQRCLTKMCDKL
ncbi:HERV-H LTR-associating protein 1 [Solea solea]|uniref:HERV-H LTR-associating protein 1 n=1 Tax=Solea solea TaxID=90069 RepID=UPI00272AB758|nr:HERV-H LTR-associating protein 1 [Solea solea]